MTSQEEQIVQACLLDNLVPSPSFQLAVSQVMNVNYTHFLGCRAVVFVLCCVECMRFALSLFPVVESNTEPRGGGCGGRSLQWQVEGHKGRSRHPQRSGGGANTLVDLPWCSG